LFPTKRITGFSDLLPDAKDVVFYAVLMEKRKEAEAFFHADIYCDAKRNVGQDRGR
jgi:hypothetical protein